MVEVQYPRGFRQVFRGGSTAILGDFKVGVSVGVYCTKCTLNTVLTPTLKSPIVSSPGFCAYTIEFILPASTLRNLTSLQPVKINAL
jgi:hypothetical protein